MLQNILKIKGVSELGKKEQLKITGGNGGVTEEDCNECNGFYVGNGYCVVDPRRKACLDRLPGED